ncbi:MAG: glycosyl hydrolase family 18 protein [Candidatus Latescibacteria bacterium]|nr:glycosyl hydrolase family 18 protein [Candidatus Latescibacterota bacterium]
MSRTRVGITCLALLSLRVAGAQPVSPHQADLIRNQDRSTSPALIGGGGRPLALRGSAARPTQRGGRVVFGFLPYWINSDYYEHIDFSLLTHIAAFSVEVNPNGSLGNDHGWPWTALINDAHKSGVRVILTATLFGDADVKTLLESSSNRQRFYRAIRDKIREGNADGVNIDFEGPGSNGWPSLVADFLRELTDYLHQELPGSEVSFASPAVDWSARWDFVDVAASCDYLFVMGYAFSGSWSGASGPTAPLSGGSRNITTTITDTRDYGEVTRDDPSKLILGVPYYGCRWTTMGDQPGASTTEFGGHPYLGVTLQTAPIHGRLWDPVSQTSWYRYFEAGRWIQVWFDDAGSLQKKFDLALSHGLRGIGMWALGYEADRAEPWSLLEQTIGRRVPTAVLRESTVPQGFVVEDNYPNPFNASTVITYHLPGAGQLEGILSDVLGQRVRSWSIEHSVGGRYQLAWNGLDDGGTDVASGVYFLRMDFTTDDQRLLSVSKRMALAR